MPEKKAILIYITLAVITAFSILFLFRNVEDNPDVSLLRNQKHRCKILGQLITHNSINDLPKEFSYRGEKDFVRYSAAADKEGQVFHVVRVTYYTRYALGDRDYVFVFDSHGKCILRSKAWRAFGNGGLFDFTCDGYIEKILAFHIAESNGELTESSPYDTALQVWRLQTPTPFILLDVRFKFFPNEQDDPNDFTDVHLGYNDRGKAQRIELADIRFNPRVTFSWSKEKKQFVCSGPLESKYWKVLFPRLD